MKNREKIRFCERISDDEQQVKWYNDLAANKKFQKILFFSQFSHLCFGSMIVDKVDVGRAARPQWQAVELWSFVLGDSRW